MTIGSPADGDLGAPADPRSPDTMTTLRRYQRFLLILVGGTLLAGYLLNTTVNPWRVTPAPWSAESLEPYRAIENAWNRTAKAGLVRSADWDAAIFGSSRADIAFDPRHPLFDGMRCVNLGLNAANLVENQAAFDDFMDHEPARLVVFAIDAGDLTTPPAGRNLTDFALSPFDRGADPVERTLRHHFGISTLAASIGTLGRAIRGSPADHTPQGFRRDAAFPPNQRQLIAGLYLATTSRMIEGRIRHDQLDPVKLGLLDAIVERCRASGTRLVLLLTPNHALFQLAPPALDDPDPYYSRDRAALAARVGGGVEFWDFLDAHPLNAEPLPPVGQPSAHFENWIDLFHATSTLGDRMLDRIHGQPGDYGVRLTPERVETRVREVREGLGRHAASHPEDVAFLHRSLDRYRPQP